MMVAVQGYRRSRPFIHPNNTGVFSWSYTHRSTPINILTSVERSVSRFNFNPKLTVECEVHIMSGIQSFTLWFTISDRIRARYLHWRASFPLYQPWSCGGAYLVFHSHFRVQSSSLWSSESVRKVSSVESDVWGCMFVAVWTLLATGSWGATFIVLFLVQWCGYYYVGVQMSQANTTELEG